MRKVILKQNIFLLMRLFLCIYSLRGNELCGNKLSSRITRGTLTNQTFCLCLRSSATCQHSTTVLLSRAVHTYATDNCWWFPLPKPTNLTTKYVGIQGSSQFVSTLTVCVWYIVRRMKNYYFHQWIHKQGVYLSQQFLSPFCFVFLFNKTTLTNLLSSTYPWQFC